jgi:hypothetical protein
MLSCKYIAFIRRRVLRKRSAISTSAISKWNIVDSLIDIQEYKEAKKLTADS